MFDATAPAASIDELLHELTKQHTPGHIYRGQTTFYETAVPSAFRAFVKEARPDGWVTLQSVVDRPHAPSVTYESERYEIKNRLARSFNRGITNLLAQQYGLSSDMFDVTGSIDVAGFFATRTWPSYQPYVPAQPDETGVIYRMHCEAAQPTLREFEELTEHFYFLREDGRKIFFENVKTLSLQGQALVAQFGLASVLQHEFPRGMQPAPLQKMPFYCQPSMMRRLIVERLNELGFGRLVGDGTPFESVEIAYDSSRTARQAGGVVSPPLRYQAAIPASLNAGPRNGTQDGLKAEPDVAVNGGLTAVFNLNHDSNFERFYFLHRPDRAVTVKHLDDLWPPREADPIFDMMCGAVIGFFADRRGIPGFDPLAVLDRGYSAVPS